VTPSGPNWPDWAARPVMLDGPQTNGNLDYFGQLWTFQTIDGFFFDADFIFFSH
jgi:hypothetical protein